MSVKNDTVCAYSLMVSILFYKKEHTLLNINFATPRRTSRKVMQIQNSKTFSSWCCKFNVEECINSLKYKEFTVSFAISLQAVVLIWVLLH